jgi:RNA polymerase sigma-70 factor, ECF subfamily
MSEDSKRPLDEILASAYYDLDRLARVYMRNERRDHTLQPTALVHEAYLRLVDQRRTGWASRTQFVAVAAVMMRRILVNHARKRATAKRDHGKRTSMSGVADVNLPPEVDVLSLHDALERLAAIDPRKARIVELKFFGGLTTGEIGEALDVSHATVERDWSFARAWLADAIAGNTARPALRRVPDRHGS